jgi:hypothetical protein
MIQNVPALTRDLLEVRTPHGLNADFTRPGVKKPQVKGHEEGKLWAGCKPLPLPSLDLPMLLGLTARLNPSCAVCPQRVISRAANTCRSDPRWGGEAQGGGRLVLCPSANSARDILPAVVTTMIAVGVLPSACESQMAAAAGAGCRDTCCQAAEDVAGLVTRWQGR